MKRLLLFVTLLHFSPLAAEMKILALSGSTRKDSYNKKLAEYAAALAKNDGATVTVIELKNLPLPFYDQDAEESEGMPKNAKTIRQLMIDSNAIIIASPEYNGSVSAVLKNVLDWASRNEDGKPSRDAFKGKKFAIMSASPGKTGGDRGLVHLRFIIEDIGGQVVQDQVTVPNAYDAFGREGKLKDPKITEQLKKEIQELF